MNQRETVSSHSSSLPPCLWGSLLIALGLEAPICRRTELQKPFSMTEDRPLTTSWHSNHLEQFGNMSKLNHKREYTIGTESGILTVVWFHSGGSAGGPRATYGLWGKSMQLSTLFCHSLNPNTVRTIAKYFWVCDWRSTEPYNLHLCLHQCVGHDQPDFCRHLRALFCTPNCPASSVGYHRGTKVLWEIWPLQCAIQANTPAYFSHTVFFPSSGR